MRPRHLQLRGAQRVHVADAPGGLYRDFTWVFIARFLVTTGNSVALFYLFYYLRDHIGHGDPDTVPESFTADLGSLDINDNVRWSDLKGTEGIRPTIPDIRPPLSAHSEGPRPVYPFNPLDYIYSFSSIFLGLALV